MEKRKEEVKRVIENRGRTYILVLVLVLVVTYLYYGYCYWYKLLLLPHQLSTLRVRRKETSIGKQIGCFCHRKAGSNRFVDPKGRQLVRTSRVDTDVV